MGCSTSDREKIEKEIMMLKIQRIGLRKERMENMKLLGGSPADCKSPIPDYIDPDFAIKRGIYQGNEKQYVNSKLQNYKKTVTFKVPQNKKKTIKLAKCQPKLRRANTFNRK